MTPVLMLRIKAAAGLFWMSGELGSTTLVMALRQVEVNSWVISGVTTVPGGAWSRRAQVELKRLLTRSVARSEPGRTVAK